MTQFHPVTGLAHGSFGIGTYRAGAISTPFPGLVQPDGTVIELTSHYPDTHAIFDDWDRALDTFVDIAARGGETGLRFEDLAALPPIRRPNLLGAASNYRQHVAEMMTNNKFNQHNRLPGESDEAFFQRNMAEIDKRAREGMPFFFTGLHSSLSGANDPIALPLLGEHPDWELELGVILARSGRYVPPEEAEDLIAGYTMINDLGVVDEFRRVDIKFGYDWSSKFQPSFKPFGPFIVPKQFVDLSEVRIQLKLNGQTMQDWPVTDMIFSAEKIISYATERVALMPGDLLMTGSPPGNAGSHGCRWLRPGDLLESEITGLGRQRNEVFAEDAKGRKPNFGPFITEW